jgi:hypothetical protein
MSTRYTPQKAAEIKAYIRQLKSPWSSQREAAQSALIGAGADAVEPLLDTLKAERLRRRFTRPLMFVVHSAYILFLAAVMYHSHLPLLLKAGFTLVSGKIM